MPNYAVKPPAAKRSPTATTKPKAPAKRKVASAPGLTDFTPGTPSGNRPSVPGFSKPKKVNPDMPKQFGSGTKTGSPKRTGRK